MIETKTKLMSETIFRQYEVGKAYHQQIGFCERARENERFFRGEQWSGIPPKGLPCPVFNVIRRTVHYLVSTVLANRLYVRYSADALPYVQSEEHAARYADSIAACNRYFQFRWERNHMDALLREGLFDAALTGDAVFYTYWDPTVPTGQPFAGDFVTERVDATQLFVADVTNDNLQSQEYVILAGRAPVSRLRREAAVCGCSAETIAAIVADDVDDAESETADIDAQKATYLIRFYRRADGKISFDRVVRGAMLQHADTGLTRYPIAYFHWDPTKHSYHGCAPVSGMIQNQKYINKAYAMVMKHMMDTAFSKVIYDKKRIPEWSNEVGQAIGILGGDVNSAVTTVGVGELQACYLDVINMTVSQTKELAGATETALGEGAANNTSAILAMREAAVLPLENVRARLCRCVEELALIFADMMCEYYGEGRLLAFEDQDGMHRDRCDFSALRGLLLRAKVEVGSGIRLTQSAQMAVLDKLLDGGYITLAQYVTRLPDGMLAERDALLEEIQKKKER